MATTTRKPRPCDHKWLARQYGGAFCRKCDIRTSRFHMHYGQVCICEEPQRAPLEGDIGDPADCPSHSEQYHAYYSRQEDNQ